MSAQILRRAALREAAAIAATFLAARRSILSVVPMVHPDESVEPWMRETLFRTTEVWVADQDGRVAAFMSLSPGWLEHLYVHPDDHGRGIGSALVGLAKTQPAASQGLQLWTFQGNAGARRFYERHGFRATEFTDGSGNEERTPDVRYEWRPEGGPIRDS
jgi:GNAT superfamily N-acetyltransferase